MSKKETEFDRYDRARKLEREASVQKRKDLDLPDSNAKKGGKPKPGAFDNRKVRFRVNELLEEEYV